MRAFKYHTSATHRMSRLYRLDLLPSTSDRHLLPNQHPNSLKLKEMSSEFVEGLPLFSKVSLDSSQTQTRTTSPLT